MARGLFWLHANTRWVGAPCVGWGGGWGGWGVTGGDGVHACMAQLWAGGSRRTGSSVTTWHTKNPPVCFLDELPARELQPLHVVALKVLDQLHHTLLQGQTYDVMITVMSGMLEQQ